MPDLPRVVTPRALSALAVPLVLTMLAVTPAEARESGLGPRMSTGAQAPGKVEIRNVQWNVARLEVRVGSAKNCELNALVGVNTIAKGRAWEITTSSEVCWRREVSPGGVWSGWQRVKPIPNGRTRVHT